MNFNIKNIKTFNLSPKNHLKRIKKSLAQSTFKKKIILILISVIVFPLLIAGITSVIFFNKEVINSYNETLKKSAVDVSCIIDEKYNSYESLISLFSQSSTIKSSLHISDDTSLKNELKSIVNSNPNIKASYIILESGIVLSYPQYDIIENHTYQRDDYYNNAVKNYNLPLWSSIKRQLKGNTMLSILSKTIYDNDNNLVGVVGIVVDITDIGKLISSIAVGNTGQILLVDGNGQIIAARHKNLVEKNINPKIKTNNNAYNNISEVSWMNNVLNAKSGFSENNFLGSKKYIYYINNFKSNWKVISIVPSSEVYSKSKATLLIMISIFFISLIAASGLGITFSNKVTRHIKSLVIAMKKGEKGDLGSNVIIDSSDEFGQLGTSFNSMISSMNSLVISLKEASNTVLFSSETLTKQAGLAAQSSKEIHTTMNSIYEGASTQAGYLENSSVIVNHFLDGIYEINDNNKVLSSESKEITSKNQSSLKAVLQLKQKNNETMVSAHTIEEKIESFINEMNNIVQNLNSIKSISTQTNVLALNASIEAARAGENGRGFAVVADEIRKLSTQTLEFTSRIQTIASNIEETSRTTMLDTKTIKQSIGAQSEAVNFTESTFIDLNLSTSKMLEILKKLEEKIIHLSDKGLILKTNIENISDVSKESASTSNSALQYVSEQMKEIENVNINSNTLNILAKGLQKKVEEFNISSSFVEVTE